MKRIPLLIMCICATTAFAQKISYSVQFGANVPAIATIEKSSRITSIPISSGYSSVAYNNVGTIQESFRGKAGCQFSGRVTIQPNSKFFLSTGLAAQFTRYERTISVENLANDFTIVNLNTNTVAGTPFSSFYTSGSVSVTGTEGMVVHKPNGAVTATFIQVPVLAGKTFFNNKLTVRAGGSMSYLVHATSYKQGFTYSNEGPMPSVIITESKQKANEQFTTLSPGLLTEVSYNVGKKLSLDLTFQKNLSALYVSEERSAGKAKLNLLSFGIGYHFNK